MTERYLVALNDFHAPHHEPGVLFDVARIVFRLPDPTCPAWKRDDEVDLCDLPIPVGSSVEFDYAAGDGGFRAVSRALAYQLRVHHTGKLSQRDSLVLVARSHFCWKGVSEGLASPPLAEFSHERGAWVRTGYGPASWKLEQVAGPMEPLTAEASSQMRTAILHWALDRNLPLYRRAT